MANLLELTAETYEGVIENSDVPVLVDFWAFWCGPCKALAPILENIQDELGDSAKIAKLDVEAFPEIAEREAVRAFPTLIIYNRGQEHSRITGVQPRQYLLNLLQSVADDDEANTAKLYEGLSIHDALLTNDVNAIKAVLESDSECIHNRDEEGDQPLRAALKRRQLDAVAALLEANPPLGFPEYVALNMRKEAAAALDEEPSLIQTYLRDDLSITQFAALWGADETLSELLRRSPPLSDLSDLKQAELLKVAVYGLNPKCINALFAAGISFHEDENMPLVAMTIRPQEDRQILEVIKLLIEKGADPNPIIHGKTVPEIAREIGWEELLPELDALFEG